VYSRILSVASETKLPFYSVLLFYYYYYLIHFAFSTPSAIVCLSSLEVLICHVGGFLQGCNKKNLLVLEQVVMCGELAVSLS